MAAHPISLSVTRAVTTAGGGVWNRVGVVASGVDGYLGGELAGVLKSGATVIFSRNVSSWRSDRALWSVSSGRIGGTPPKPSNRNVRGVGDTCNE